MAKIGDLTVNVHIKVVGVGGRRRLKFLCFIARILMIELEPVIV